MPRLPINYQNTIIYVIKCKDDNITEEYIGSTTNFRERKHNHRQTCNNENNRDYNLKVYKYIRENGGWDNWIMLEIEKYPCNDKREAEKREEEIRLERKAQLNSNKAFVAETKEEYNKNYYEENKEEIKEYYKKYREENKEYLINFEKERYKIRREYVIEYQKVYNKINNNIIKDKKKIYSEKRRNEEYKCLCGWIGNMDSKSKHINNSKQHQDFINK